MGINACTLSAAEANQLSTLDVIGSVLLREVYCTDLEYLKRIVTHSEGSCATQDNPVLKTTETYVPSRALYIYQPREKAL